MVATGGVRIGGEVVRKDVSLPGWKGRKDDAE